MYPYLRFLRVMIAGQWGPRIGFEAASELRLLVWPGDIDFYPEVNNGRHLTLMDLGRMDLAVRSGLIREAHRRGWGFVVSGAGVTYRHRLPPFRRFTLRTRALGHDGRWIYFHQETERDGRICSAALIRGGLRSRQGLVPVSEVLEAIGQAGWAPELPSWVRAWIAAIPMAGGAPSNKLEGAGDSGA